MSPVILFIIIAAIVAAIIFVPMGIAWMVSNQNGFNRSRKQELRELRQFKQDVRSVTARTEDVNPELAALIQGLLYDIETKELN